MAESNLCILDDQMPRRQYEGNQRGRKQHLDDCDISIVAAEYFGEWVRVVYSEAFRSADCETSIVLVERHKVHLRHGE